MPSINNEDTEKNNLANAEGSEDVLVKCEKERQEYLAGWQRAKADFLNYKKEEMARFSDMARYGSEDLIRDLITVLDNFDLGLRALERAGPVEKGVYMIRTHLDDIVKKRGVEKIQVAIGSLFDPSVAEAIAEGESEHPPGSVIEIIEPGYKLYDKILRPVRVRIAKEKEQIKIL
jgi:molecular chaperone GrpE